MQNYFDKYESLCRHGDDDDEDDEVTKTVGASWFDGFADAQLLWVASKIRYISLRGLVFKMTNLDQDVNLVIDLNQNGSMVSLTLSFCRWPARSGTLVCLFSCSKL